LQLVINMFYPDVFRSVIQPRRSAQYFHRREWV
jgi:hypothetical protein